METERVKISQLQVNEQNPRTCTDKQFEKLVRSVITFPKMLEVRPIVVGDGGVALGGNMRLRALQAIATMTDEEIMRHIEQSAKYNGRPEVEREALLRYWKKWQHEPMVSVVRTDNMTEDERMEFIIKDNVGFGAWDWDMLANDWDTDELDDWGLTAWVEQPTDKDGDNDQDIKSNASAKGSIERRFLIPPFSVLDARTGRWHKRKQYWLGMGIRSDVGRGEELTFGKSAQTSCYYDVRNMMREKNGGKDPSFEEVTSYMKKHGKNLQPTTSIFDPVLCECAYRWFMPNGGTHIVDPFCGGSVRGIVASKCGYEYFGRDISKRQVEANEEQVAYICGEDDPKPTYSIGDSQYIGQVYDEGKADLLFSCPPYADLEVYSDDEADISNMPYPRFLEVYRKIISEACKLLHNDRFAVWVISEVRSKDGEYYNLVSDTIQAFRDAGLHYYNEIILCNATTSACIRAPRQFNSTRKVVRTHQNVLVFFKGDMRTIKDNYGELDLSYLQDEMAEDGDEAE